MPSPVPIYLFLLAISLRCVLAFPGTDSTGFPEFTHSTSKFVKRQVPPDCETQLTPACLQALYGIPKTRATQRTNSIAVAGFLDQVADKADLATFLQTMRPDLAPAPTFNEVTLGGSGNNQNVPKVALVANLNVQYTIGLASGVPTTYYAVGGNFIDGLKDLSSHLLSLDDPPSVLILTHSMDEKDVGAKTAKNLCDDFTQLGQRGISIIVSSGNGGVSGNGESTDCVQFVPTFPASCPFVTSVGGTTLISEAGSRVSAGGFSNIFSQPFYQNMAVSTYLSGIGKLYADLYSRDGRAFPDVAAQSKAIVVTYKGENTVFEGTEASALIFGSMIALLNDELISVGRPKLGFLNALLYSQGVNGLTDITSGSNPGCNTDGFPAVKGWDPITGLGTPNYAALRKVVGL
ncbi:hypothetical protein BGZ93_000773 [Podila epicladia]|nr:hypothetical protein BGZ92_008833 [Podila epicladia]KAG0098228.1 hypothetical protein BGZ93_000773 [Podila epicladia]